jgi:hypothetical protein
MAHPGVELDAHARTVGSQPKAASVNWPLAVDRRLDQLVDLANSAGANTKRNEMAAAIVSTAVPDPEQLLQLLIHYRRTTVRDVVLDVPDAATAVELPRYSPGRRRIS